MTAPGFIIDQIGKAAVLGTAIVFASNIICFTASRFVPGQTAASPITWLLAVLFAFISVADLVIAFVLKKKLLSPLNSPQSKLGQGEIAAMITRVTIVTAALCAAPPVYGLVVVLLGGKLELMAAFSVVSLGGYMLLRSRLRDFGSFFGGHSLL